MGPASGRKQAGTFRQHSLGLAVAAIVLLWLWLYARRSETRRGAFYGNALADWLGSLMIVIATKYFYELGRRRAAARTRGPVPLHPVSHRPLADYRPRPQRRGVARPDASLDPQGKAGQVVGNILSEWTQVLGLVIMTKYLWEIGRRKARLSFLAAGYLEVRACHGRLKSTHGIYGIRFSHNTDATVMGLSVAK